RGLAPGMYLSLRSRCRMEPVLDKATMIRPSYIASIELSPRKWPVNVEDLKADLSDEFSLVSSNLDISQDCVSIQDSTSIILKGPKNSMICQLSEKNVGQMVQKFTFSRVFGPETTQEEFFDGTVKQPVQDFLEGHNRLIFTYGVTNAGKTYTFQDMDFKPLRCKDYIRLTKEQVREEIAVKNSILRLMKEVDSQNSINNHSKTSESSEDLQWIQVSDSKEAFKLLKLGLKHQSIACTKLNTYSSRSHSIFTVKMLKIEDSEAPNVTRVSELALCDLAGSERCTKTRNEGDRLKESGNINTSLLILGKCINALKNSQRSKLQLHIPFRESKLTHFLQGFFSGKGKVYMIVNISQCAYDETLNVLKFSAIAQKNASNAPQDHPFVQKSAREVSLINNVDTKIQVARKRATVLWDRSLEDVIEDDDDLTVDNNETHEEHDMAKEMPNEEEENKVIIGKEDYLDNTVTTIKRQMPKENSDGTIEGTQSSESVKHGLDVGRKHCFESKPTQEEEPPTKKDTISTTAEQGSFRKNLNPMSEQKQKFAIRKLYHLRRRKSAKIKC
ncbi:hypothetical protein KIL84_009520, partial [Mauremys mutica]